jgi:hypothetical protein
MLSCADLRAVRVLRVLLLGVRAAAHHETRVQALFHLVWCHLTSVEPIHMRLLGGGEDGAGSSIFSAGWIDRIQLPRVMLDLWCWCMVNSRSAK